MHVTRSREGRMAMVFTADQLKALDQGRAVPVHIDQRDCVVVRRDVYDRTTRIPYDDSEMNPAEAYPFVDEVMADDDADDPTLAYYQGESRREVRWSSSTSRVSPDRRPSGGRPSWFRTTPTIGAWRTPSSTNRIRQKSRPASFSWPTTAITRAARLMQRTWLLPSRRGPVVIFVDTGPCWLVI